MGRLTNMLENRVGNAGTTSKGVVIYSPLGERLGGSVGQTLGSTPSTTQYYDLGTRAVTGDGRVFRYAKAGATLISGYGCECYGSQHIAYATLTAATAAGGNSVTFSAAATDGPAGGGASGDGAIAADEMKGGYIIIMDSDGTSAQNRMITGNTVTAAGGGTITVTFDEPTYVALTTSDHVECMASPYRDVRSTTYGHASIVGVPTIPATVGQYLWIQTWGACWVTPQPRVSTELYQDQLVFRHDGTVDAHVYSDANVTQAQHAGFVLAHAHGGGQGACFVMLQISI